MKKYWIKFQHWYCAHCGRERTEQERITQEKKPKDVNQRHINNGYDLCGNCNAKDF